MSVERGILEAVARADLILCWAWRIGRLTLYIAVGIAVGKWMVRRDAR